MRTNVPLLWDLKGSIMFYRQKILLGLIEIFGGKLSKTDLEKLLFLFCQNSGKNFYDFFPYHYGPFSFISYYDKNKLIKEGKLLNSEKFEIKSPSNYFSKLNSEDKILLRDFHLEHYMLKGNQLLKKTYVEYPNFATRSKIAKKMLKSEDLANLHVNNLISNLPTLFTIGYEGITIDAYLNKLIKHDIKVLIDVRKNPLSRKHGFSKKQFREYINKVGIDYLHMPELGVPSKFRKSLNDTDSYSKLFELYTSEILPLGDDSLNLIVDKLGKFDRVALTCFEKDHLMCHRNKISERLIDDQKLSLQVKHI